MSWFQYWYFYWTHITIVYWINDAENSFLCADFNIDILKHKVDKGTESFLDTMYSIGLYPLIDRPTVLVTTPFH